MELVSCRHDALLQGQRQSFLRGQTGDQLVDSLGGGGDLLSAAAQVGVSVFTWKEEEDSQIIEMTPTAIISVIEWDLDTFLILMSIFFLHELF